MRPSIPVIQHISLLNTGILGLIFQEFFEQNAVVRRFQSDILSKKQAKTKLTQMEMSADHEE